MKTFHFCDACRKPRLESEIQHDGDLTFCYPYTTCDRDGALELCDGCEQAFPEDEVLNGGEYEPHLTLCYDCKLNSH